MGESSNAVKKWSVLGLFTENRLLLAENHFPSKADTEKP